MSRQAELTHQNAYIHLFILGADRKSDGNRGNDIFSRDRDHCRKKRQRWKDQDRAIPISQRCNGADHKSGSKAHGMRAKLSAQLILEGENLFHQLR